MPQKKHVRCVQPVISLEPSHDDSQTDAGDCNGRQLLSQAAERGDEQQVEFLLKDRQLDPNSRDNDCTPLLRSKLKNHRRVAELLLADSRVDPNCRDSNGRTPLSHAAERGIGELVILLLKNSRVDPDCRDSNGRTPLSRAAECGNGVLVKLLLANSRVDPDCRDGNGRTPLSRAAECGNGVLVKLLLANSRVDPNCRDSSGRTPLSHAAGQNHEHVVEMLIEPARLKPESKDTAGRTPLSWAMNCFVQGSYTKVTNQDCGVVKLLLSQDTVDPNSRDQEGRTPLSWAIEYLPRTEDNLPSVFDLLLNRSRDSLKSKDCYGRTLLSRAAETGKRTAVLDFLLKRENVDPDSSDNAGRTPLWWAAKSGRMTVVESLLARKGVNPESMDNDGHTPLLCAIDNEHTVIIRLLIKRDGITLHKLAQNGTIASLRSLLESGNDVNDANGNTPLRVALEKEQLGIVQLLLRHSAHTEGIMSAEWLHAYNEGASDVVLELSQMSSGRKSVQIVEARRVKIYYCRLFSSYSTWSGCLACNPKVVLERNRSDIFHKFKICKDYDVVFVVGSFPKQLQVADQELSPASLWTECAIAWKMLLPSNSTDKTCWKSTDHFSTLPYGWIPDDGAEFFALFVCRLKENWLEFCATGQERLSRRRLDQLCAKGNSAELIHCLAGDAREWAELRSALRGQIQAAKKFAVKYCRKYDQGNSRRTMHLAIDQFNTDVNEQINRLDQTVKDLLQFEFAWVSINEAHKSTKIATSMNRLSWVTV
ncbi:ankyrin [Ophiobolus disseminans]|uniref:Ankyrin n=1 Tax=Ophiobolus disseminans TaxID=1469910 RepID=A0A6A6ZTY0_9PLEO|nr:ankyrin [Ophiobolus disseminans]